MSLFGFGKRNREEKPASGTMKREELYGKAWLLIVSQKREQGLEIMRQLDADGYSEATVVLGMFPQQSSDRMKYVTRAADMGNVEGIWEYSGMLRHAFRPDMGNADDRKWAETVLKAAEGGSVDAMNEMGNICNRLGNFSEAMYWYAVANACGQQDGIVSMNGVAGKWKSAGAPYEFRKGSPKFDEARHRCATAYLEIHAQKDLSVSPDEVVKYVLAGVPIAAYLAGDIFEELGNDEMACRMYSAIASESDPHGMKCYADMLFTGRGTDKDVQNALGFYQKAAELGDRAAMFTMGEFTRGSDRSMAAYWYGLSHTRGYEHALTRLLQVASS